MIALLENTTTRSNCRMQIIQGKLIMCQSLIMLIKSYNNVYSISSIPDTHIHSHLLFELRCQHLSPEAHPLHLYDHQQQQGEAEQPLEIQALWMAHLHWLLHQSASAPVYTQASRVTEYQRCGGTLTQFLEIINKPSSIQCPTSSRNAMYSTVACICF